MKITTIKQQERLKSRYSVYVDDKYAFSLSADALLEQGLHSGIELDEQQLQTFKKLSSDDKAYGLAIAYIARRMRSEWEVTDYFKRKGYEPELASQLLERLRRLDLLNDGKFAEAWVRNRRLLRTTSRRRLSQELKQKHVSDEVIEQALREDESDERQILRQLIERKRRQTKYQDNLKLMQYLARQGFSYDDIKRCLNEPEEYS